MPQRPAKCQPLFSFSSIFLEDPVAFQRNSLAKQESGNCIG